MKYNYGLKHESIYFIIDKFEVNKTDFNGI